MNWYLRNKLRLAGHIFLRRLTDINYLLSTAGTRSPILVYHRVCPLHYKKMIPYANVFTYEFDKQMQYVRDNFESITVSEYVQRATNDQISGHELCVTFDDGFKDNYLYAFPILKKYGIKATFFLVTAYIGQDTLFPWMVIDEGGLIDISENRERWLPLSWENVREMALQGMEFGTHTHTHKDSLSKMALEESKTEIEECTRVFEEKMGFSPRVFSYPHGTYKDYDDNHIEMLKKVNYNVALTTNIGRNGKLESFFELKRLIIYETDSLHEFKKKVHGAYDIAEKLQKAWLTIAGSQPYRIKV